MTLPVGGDIGSETHATTDQTFIIVKGEGRANIGNEIQPFEKKDILFVPAGTVHDIVNTGQVDLKLLTVYSPPNHPDGTVQATKEG